MDEAFAELEEGNDEALKARQGGRRQLQPPFPAIQLPLLSYTKCYLAATAHGPPCALTSHPAQAVFERQKAQLSELIELINGDLTK